MYNHIFDHFQGKFRNAEAACGRFSLPDCLSLHGLEMEALRSRPHISLQCPYTQWTRKRKICMQATKSKSLSLLGRQTALFLKPKSAKFRDVLVIDRLTLPICMGTDSTEDVRILPWICLTYLVMRVDISNISNAAIMNAEKGHDIKKQLHLSTQEWTWAIACFFYPYAAFEPISTLLMKKTTPSFWIGRIMITWG